MEIMTRVHLNDTFNQKKTQFVQRGEWPSGLGHRFSDLFMGYKKATLDCNGLIVRVIVWKKASEYCKILLFFYKMPKHFFFVKTENCC